MVRPRSGRGGTCDTAGIPFPLKRIGDVSSEHDILWGAATAAYQIEGAVNDDGRGASIWDTYSAIPGKTRDGDTGAVACDHYRRWEEDVALMKDLGFTAYRFSVAWPRIIPTGVGQVNPKGIEFYRRLAGTLRDEGIEPCATLYHWDAPQAIEDRGGWPSRETAKAFETYARVVFRELGDVVKHWATFNEPSSTSFVGHCNTTVAPGRREPPSAVAASDTILLAHGLAVRAFREGGYDGQIGIVLDVMPVQPATDSPADVAAAKRVELYMNHWWLRPVFAGQRPEPFSYWVERCPSQLTDEDLKIVSTPLDFLGWNYYMRFVIEEDLDDLLYQARVVKVPGGTYAPRDWEVYPDGVVEFLGWLRDNYWDGPVYITENGCSCGEVPDENGYVQDDERMEYIRAHVTKALEARRQGFDLRGYFVWSLMDNFEWRLGYSARMGIIRVDYPTQRRTVKKSGLWYARFIRTGRLDTEGLQN